NNRFELFRAPSDGSTAPVALYPGLPNFASAAPDYEIDAAGELALFIVDALTNGVPEVFVAPLDGSSAPVRLNATLVSGGRVFEAHFTPDGTRVVYRAD